MTSMTRTVRVRPALAMAAALLLLGGMVADLSAQTRTRPTRPYRGLFGGGQQTPDPNRTRTELTLTGGVTAGYDDNVAAAEGSGLGSGVPSAATSGYAGQANAALDFFYGKASRSIRVVGSSYLQAYPEFLDAAVPGFALDVAGVTDLGRRMSLTVGQRVSYDPLFSFRRLPGADLPTDPGIAPLAQDIGLYERRSLTTFSTTSLNRRWSRRNDSTVFYGYSTQRHDDDLGNSREHTARVDFRRTLSTRMSVQTAYTYVNTEFTDFSGVTRPVLQHSVEGGPELVFRLSARRSLSLSGRGGARHVETVRRASDERYRYWAPFGSAAMAFALSDTTSLSAGYRRSLSFLEGLTSQSYYTDSVAVSFASLLTSRIDLRLGGNVSSGRTSSTSGSLSSFRVYSASTEVRTALSRFAALIAAYNYYFHRYSDPSELPPGFPAEYDRNSVRVGVTFWVPLRGTYATR